MIDYFQQQGIDPETGTLLIGEIMAEDMLPADTCEQNKGFTAEEVLEEIERQQSEKKNWTSNLTILIITMIIFFQLGLFDRGVSDVLIVIFVILVHEAGHFIAMHLFGYKNVQVFFIPMFGAAVSGQSQNAPAYKKAIVTLLGPVPGIFLGLACCIAYAVTRTPFLHRLMAMFLLINIFNLLPFFPLDGGRFLHEVLFARNRYIELIFRVIASLILIGIGLAMGGWFLAIFGAFSLIGAQFPFKVARIAKELNAAAPAVQEDDELAALTAEQEAYAPTDQQKKPAPTQITTEEIERIIDRIPDHISGAMNLKTLAGYTKQVWERMQMHPPGTGATFGLLGLYSACVILSFVAIIGAALVSLDYMPYPVNSKVVEFQMPDGTTGKKEQTFYAGRIMSETELDANEALFHGRTTWYGADGSVFKKGWYHEGRRDGLWETFDPNGHKLFTTSWDKGTFLHRTERENGKWAEKAIEELPDEM
jgi:Zn-dependent protease